MIDQAWVRRFPPRPEPGRHEGRCRSPRGAAGAACAGREVMHGTSSNGGERPPSQDGPGDHSLGPALAREAMQNSDTPFDSWGDSNRYVRLDSPPPPVRPAQRRPPQRLPPAARGRTHLPRLLAAGRTGPRYCGGSSRTTPRTSPRGICWATAASTAWPTRRAARRRRSGISPPAWPCGRASTAPGSTAAWRTCV